MGPRATARVRSSGGAIHVEGDPVAGYLLTIEVPDGGLPVNTWSPSGRRVRHGRTKPAMKSLVRRALADSRAWLFAGGEQTEAISVAGIAFAPGFVRRERTHG